MSNHRRDDYNKANASDSSRRVPPEGPGKQPEGEDACPGAIQQYSLEISVLETKQFTARSRVLLTPETKAELLWKVVSDPEFGQVLHSDKNTGTKIVVAMYLGFRVIYTDMRFVGEILMVSIDNHSGDDPEPPHPKGGRFAKLLGKFIWVAIGAAIKKFLDIVLKVQVADRGDIGFDGFARLPRSIKARTPFIGSTDDWQEKHLAPALAPAAVNMALLVQPRRQRAARYAVTIDGVRVQLHGETAIASALLALASTSRERSASLWRVCTVAAVSDHMLVSRAALDLDVVSDTLGETALIFVGDNARGEIALIHVGDNACALVELDQVAADHGERARVGKLASIKVFALDGKTTCEVIRAGDNAYALVELDQGAADHGGRARVGDNACIKVFGLDDKASCKGASVLVSGSAVGSAGLSWADRRRLGVLLATQIGGSCLSSNVRHLGVEGKCAAMIVSSSRAPLYKSRTLPSTGIGHD